MRGRGGAANLQGLVDLLPGGLGGVQGVDELDVVKQAASGTGQQLQDLVLQFSLQSKSHALKMCYDTHARMRHSNKYPAFVQRQLGETNLGQNMTPLHG